MAVKINDLPSATSINNSDVVLMDDGTTTKKVTKEILLNGVVAKEDGKGLSTNDFTNAYKGQVDTNKADISANKEDITNLKALGLSVIDGEINITYEGE